MTDNNSIDSKADKIPAQEARAGRRGLPVFYMLISGVAGAIIGFLLAGLIA